MSKPLTLNSVRLELDSWRATREKQGRLPDTIWDKILNLLKDSLYDGYIARFQREHTYKLLLFAS